MKSQTQHIGNYSNVFDYSPFGTPLDGRTVENVFSQLKADTIVVADTLFIINNDFENAVIEPNGAGVKIDGWTHYSPSTTLDVATTNGSKKLKVISTIGTHGAHQAFSVEPGESYTFEIDLHRPAGMNKEINVVIWKNTGPSGALSVHVLNVDGTNTFTYNATSSDIFIQIRQAGTYYLDNIRMYRTYEDTIFVSGYKMDRAYRYGFNSMERDNEIKGKGNSYDFGARMYDPRIARFITPDPLMNQNATWSPYVFGLNNPIVFVDENGEWPGVTFFFFEFEVGAGLGYGLNYVEQSGIAYDEVGKTKFIMTNAIYIVNQNLEEGSRDPNLVAGASISLTANVKQNWSAETFSGLISQGSSNYPVPVGKGAAGLAVNVGFSGNEFSFGLGIGAGLKISHLNSRIKESVSLTDAEASKVSKSTDVWANSWIVNNSQAILDGDGNVTGYKATVATRNTKGELIDTGISIFSGATTDSDGNTTSTGVWMSKSYQTEAAKAEEKK